MSLPGQKTFLQMQQEISGYVVRQSIATATTNPTLTQIQQFLNDAYQEICSERDWWFLFNTAQFPTTAGQTAPYDPGALANGGPVNVQEVLSMTIPQFQFPMIFGSWADWITRFPGRYTNVGQTKPWAWIEGPASATNDLQFYLFPASDQAYTIEFGYKMLVTPMVNNGDIPVIPAEFQQVIVNRALQKCFRYLDDARFELYMDLPGENTDARWRLDQLWQRQEEHAERITKLRNFKAENALVSMYDINRQLFVPW